MELATPRTRILGGGGGGGGEGEEGGGKEAHFWGELTGSEPTNFPF